MALNTFGIELHWGESADSVAKVVSIKDFPDMLGAPEQLETTTLSDAAQTFIPGIRQASELTFTYNYTKEDFAKVEGDAHKPLHYALIFSDGAKFTWQGQHTSGLPGKGVNEVIDAQIVISASTAVDFVTE